MDSDGSHIIFGAVFSAVLIAVRAFYTACETACTEISDGKVKSFENEKGAKAVLYRLLEKPFELTAAFSSHRILNAVMLSLTVIYSFFGPLYEFAAKLASKQDTEGYYLPAAFLSAAAVAFGTVVLLEALGDGLPKRLVRSGDPEKLAVRTAYAVKLLNTLMIPVTFISETISKLLAVLLGAGNSDKGDTITEEEILLMVDAGNETGSIESSEREMINNVFEFHEMAVSDVMTHRTDMVAVSIDAEISEVVYTAINSGFSRIPVYRDSIDHIEGIIYVKDLLCLIGTQSAEGITVERFLRDAEFVPESCMCDELFRMLTARKLQLAVVVDEYGGTSGLVTMEDLVEAIVGNIQDEYDNEAEEITRISDDTYTIKGTADPFDVMEMLGSPLPDDSEYDTMGGFVTALLGHIPEDGETPSVSYGNVVFTVLLAEDMRIIRIKAVINNDKTEKEQLNNDEEQKA